MTFAYHFEKCHDVYLSGYMNDTAFIVENPDCSIIQYKTVQKNSDIPLEKYWTAQFCNGPRKEVEIIITNLY